jgi:hypothetical protein
MFAEMLALAYQTTCCNIPEDGNPKEEFHLAYFYSLYIALNFKIDHDRFLL